MIETSKLLTPVNRIKDSRGVLSSFEFDSDIPFIPKRAFFISEVPIGIERGGHAHKKCEQFLVSITGEWQLTLNSGEVNIGFELSETSKGIYIPVNTFVTFVSMREGSTLCVFASEKFDLDDYTYLSRI